MALALDFILNVGLLVGLADKHQSRIHCWSIVGRSLVDGQRTNRRIEFVILAQQPDLGSVSSNTKSLGIFSLDGADFSK